MIDTCVQYGNEHGLKFSTDEDPQKCKTKCMAFLTKERDLGEPNLIGKKLL